MTAHQDERNLLSSWKEIADYLRCDERTCRRWELNLGLPIHRVEGAAKSRVYAYKDELDSWRREKLGVSDGDREAPFNPQPGSKFEPENALSSKGRRKSKRKLLWLIPAVSGILAAAIFLVRSRPGEPADFKISGSKVVLLDGKANELWFFNTKLAVLAPEERYRQRLQVRGISTDGRRMFPHLVFEDINLDGRIEVLFCTKTPDEYNESGLFCFDWRGKKLWHYEPGRELDFGGLAYSAEYRIDGIEPRDIDGDGRLEIFVVTAHQPHSPSGLVVLDCRGNRLGEFHNFGRIQDLAYADFDADGKPEVAAAGENDEYGKACLAVFDPLRIAGSSPQGKEFASRRCGPGSEEYYLLFPRTDVDMILNSAKENVRAIHLLESNLLELNTAISHIFFELDFDFRVQDVKGSDIFRENHQKLRAAGKITSELNAPYYQKLKEGVLYWNGTEWTLTPSRNIPLAGAQGSR